MSAAPRVTAVVPVMGHPVLLDDALASAAALIDEGTLARIVAVDDGCRFGQTRAGLAAWAALLGPGRMTVLHQPNRGLSAARNAGIEAALADPEPPEAIFLLDADNRLAAGAGRAFGALLAADPAADWFYPNFDFFGQDGHYATEHAPSPLMHMILNHSEAGSLIRRRVFEAGLRFDESMRDGYEDWDFFLSAQERGFAGRPAGRPLLQYRKRPSSMLAGSHALDAQLRRLIARRHRWLFSAAGALACEHEAFPRFAFVDGPRLWLGTDLTRAREAPGGQLEAMLFRHVGAPLRHHAPAVTLVGSAAFRDRLERDGLLPGLLWNIERRFLRQPGCGMIAVVPESTDDLGGIGDIARWDGAAPAAMIAFPLATLVRAAERRLGGSGMPALADRLNAERLTLLLPAGATGARDARDEAATLIEGLAASRFHTSLATPWEWRDIGGASSRARANEAPRLTASGGPLLPLLQVADGGLDIGFTLPIFDHGGVEKVAQAVAREFAADGHRCHLFVIGGRPARLEGGDRPDGFASVSFFPDPSAADWAGPEYMGTAETSWGNPEERADLEGLLRPMDVVINAHSAAVHRVAPALRRGGTLMLDHEHVLEVSRYGRGYGPPILALAYENAYDAILACSQGMADWLAAHGVPAAKLIPVVNAPGYPMAPDEVAAARAARRPATESRPLSILYLGRLDEQKGIDRVAAVFSGLSRTRRGFRMTLAGRAIVGPASPLVGLPPETCLPGPAVGPAALTAAFTEADILILPSRYEGLPLVILEAQRLGCVPVATDVGAVAEAITDGETGVVVPEEDCVARMVERIIALDDDRAALEAMSRRTAEAVHDWRTATEGLRAWIAARARA